jgi:tetratricopeptide (TPR) repeat protein
MIARAVTEGASGPKIERLLADLAMAEGRAAEALARYRALLELEPSQQLYEQTGLAALRAGEVNEAARLLEQAVLLPGAGWKAWNARGVVADLQGDWTGADRAYLAAASRAPGEAAAWNNLGWSLLLRGRWAEAVPPLTRAHRLAPGNTRINANLDLARSAVAAELPRRRAGESGADFAARLNDAGVMARLGGDKARAAAAFAQALEASPTWFAPAATNLAALEGSGAGTQGLERTDASRPLERPANGAVTKRK